MTETLLPSPSVTEPRASTSGAASGVAGVAVGEAKRKTRAACDACHLRRVKCEYRNPGQPVCIKCEKKGIRCTSSFIKPYKPRTGKRIEQARSVYGILTPAIDSNGNELPSDSRLIAFSSALTIADQLFYADNANATVQHLIESQMEIMPYSLSNLVWPNVLGLIQQVNMRFEDLEDELQVVIACLLATGARASNHAAILGDSSQKIDDLWGKDLSAYGKTRGPMVHSLINRAVRLADRAGLMRRATLKSIVALLMLEQLLNQADPSCRSGYSYLSGACDHLRTLLGAEETPAEVRNQLLHHVAPFLFSRDALAAAASERFPNLTNWDLRAFFADSPFGLDAFLGTEDIQNREHWSKETRIIGLNIRIAALARAFLETASSPLAKKIATVTPDVVERLWSELDLVRKEIAKLQMGPMETLPEYYVPMCASLARLLFQCHRQLHLRLQRTFSPSSVQEIDGLAEMDGLSQIWPISNNKVDKEIAFLSELFQRVLTDPVRRKAPSLLTIRHLVNALLQLPDGVERLSRLLLLDPGLRIQVLQTLKTFAFAFPDVVDVITKLEGPPAPMSNLSMSPAPPPPTALPMPHQTSPTPAPPEMLHFFGAMQDRNIFAGNPPSAVVVSSPPNFLPGSPTLRSLHGMSIHGLQPPMTPDPFAAQQLPVDGAGGWYQNYFFDNNLRG